MSYIPTIQISSSYGGIVWYGSKYQKNMKASKLNLYIAPQIDNIKLDVEICLQLESEPPVFPGENISKAPEFFKNNPFNTTEV